MLASYIDEVESGIVRDRRAWLVRYPEFYDELSDFFTDRDGFEKIAAPLRDVSRAGEDEMSLDWLDPPAHPEHLGRLAGYEVTDWLGRGGMGVVFKGFDESLNRYVAIKVLAPQWAPDANARRRFSREARAAAAISHPHVITIHAVGEWKARPFLVMEYVTGVSLQQRLDDGPRLELRDILRIGMQIASGLADAHAQGLIHRDIKPANIMLENDLARVKITDFGLARAVDDTFLTQHGTLAGTPRYMAPEQARGDRLDRRADLFSLGGVLYALCTGQPAFQGDSTPAVIRQVCEAQPTPIRVLEPEIPIWLVEIIDRLLDKDPAGRFQSASEVAELLGRHLARDQDPKPSPGRTSLGETCSPSSPFAPREMARGDRAAPRRVGRDSLDGPRNGRADGWARGANDKARSPRTRPSSSESDLSSGLSWGPIRRTGGSARGSMLTTRPSSVPARTACGFACPWAWGRPLESARHSACGAISRSPRRSGSSRTPARMWATASAPSC